MANFAQATYMGSELIIECDSRWDCCQREQAQYKARQMNANLPGQGLQANVSAATNALKDAAQRAATQRMDVQSPGEQAEDAQAAGAAPCLVKQLREGGTRRGMGLQMDHPLDVKIGGAAQPPFLTPLDAAVNGAFGSFAKNVGNRMIEAGATEIRSVTLICPPSYPGCPSESHNVGTRTEFPSHWYKTEFKRLAQMPSFLIA
jgi:hypothetical protein